MSLFLGNIQIHGVATGDAAVSGVSENLDTELTTQDNLIAQITAALDGKGVPSGGASTKTVHITTTADSNGYSEPVGYILATESGVDAQHAEYTSTNEETLTLSAGEMLIVSFGGTSTQYLTLEGGLLYATYWGNPYFITIDPSSNEDIYLCGHTEDP